MYYSIEWLCPHPDTMGGAGFSIMLHPKWKEAVAKAELTQEEINHYIKGMHREWLDGCGYSIMHDPDALRTPPWEKQPPLGPNAYPLYDEFAIRITWGEWGPEHISVPGDACGLDINQFGGRMQLSPHNVDNINQAHLLLVIFTSLASSICGAYTDSFGTEGGEG